jgi:hypothetical protein
MPWWPGGISVTQGSPPVSDTLEVSSPSYFISLLNMQPQGRALGFGDDDWDIPWIQNKVTLGAMARWKALYLINGYDRVWQLMRSLQDQVKPYINPDQGINIPAVMHLDDGTIADGDWSTRELYNVLRLPTGPIYGGYTFTITWGQEGVQLSSGYSMTKLLYFLQWTSGLHDTGAPPSNQPLGGRPLSFRALLASCDDQSYSLPLTPGG